MGEVACGRDIPLSALRVTFPFNPFGVKQDSKNVRHSMGFLDNATTLRSVPPQAVGRNDGGTPASAVIMSGGVSRSRIIPYYEVQGNPMGFLDKLGMTLYPSSSPAWINEQEQAREENLKEFTKT